jgi:hypothetical protein
MEPDNFGRAACEPLTTTDRLGRNLVARRPTALDTLRLFKAAGPVLAQNESWLALAGLAYSVVSIDDVPVPTQTTEAQIEAVVAKLGEAGIDAVAKLIEPVQAQADLEAFSGN